MKPNLLALCATALVACGDGGQEPSPTVADTVYIWPRFEEAVDPDLIPQVSDHEWELDGTTYGRYGFGALPGETVVLRLRAKYYAPLDMAIVVPDTVRPDPDDSQRRLFPVFIIHRIVPALLRAEWAADFTGAVTRVEIHAPHGLAGVTLTSTYVYFQACRDILTDVFCENRLTGNAGGPSWADPGAVGTRGWANLVGPWRGWPGGMPPAGYSAMIEDGEAIPGWSAVLNIDLTDDQGHVGHGGCVGGLIPDPGRELVCDILFSQ